MDTLEIPNQESTEEKLIEAINQLDVVGFGVGAAICQVCGSFLREGECVGVYVFRSVSSVSYQSGYVLCAEHRDEFVAEWTLGVHEVVVRGRVGRVVDVAVQSSWRVLLAPVPVVVSSADSREAVRVGEIGANTVSGGAAESCSSDDAVESNDVMDVDELREPTVAGRSIGGLGSRVDGGAGSGDVCDEWLGCGGDGGGGDA